MYDGAKSWVGDTHEPSPRATVKDHGTKRRLSPSSPPESHLTQVRNLHHNWLLSSNKWNKILGLLWLLCWLCGSFLEEYLDYAYKNQKQNKNSRTPDQILHLRRSLTCLKTWLTWDKICFLRPDLQLWIFFRAFSWMERGEGQVCQNEWGTRAGFSGQCGLQAPGTTGTMGTCEGPSSVTWLGPFCHRQEGTMGGLATFTTLTWAAQDSVFVKSLHTFSTYTLKLFGCWILNLCVAHLSEDELWKFLFATVVCCVILGNLLMSSGYR